MGSILRIGAAVLGVVAIFSVMSAFLTDNAFYILKSIGAGVVMAIASTLLFRASKDMP